MAEELEPGSKILSTLTSYIYTGVMPDKAEVVSFKETGLKLTKRFLNKIKIRQCYTNAFRVAFAYPQVEYVEGEVILPKVGIPIVHAWNCVDGKHFDLTFELHHPNSLSNEHYPSVRGTIKDLTLQGYDFQISADLFTQWLNRPETNAGNENSLWYKMTQTT